MTTDERHYWHQEMLNEHAAKKQSRRENHKNRKTHKKIIPIILL